MPTAGPPETARAAPAKQGVDFSGTNVQEEGVDEPDIVKTDGNTLFAVAGGTLRAVDVGGSKPRLLDSLALEPSSSHELLLHGDRLLVLSRGGYWIEPLPAMAARMMPYQPSKSVLSEVDVSNPSPAAPRPHAHARRLLRRGTARRLGRADRRRRADAVRAALQAAHRRLPEAIAAAGQAEPRRSRPLKVASWLPSYRIKRPGARPARRARSCSAATSAARPRSRASAC